MEAISLAIVYLGALVFLVFASVCLATGLYYIADLIEEHSTLAKKLLTWTIRAVLLLHAALLLDEVPVTCTLVGAAAHLFYMHTLRKYPCMDVLSWEFLISAGMLVTSQVLWMHHFYDTYHSMEFVLGFFCVMVWTVPFIMFIGLSANENVLPGAPGGPSYQRAPQQAPGRRTGQSAKRGLLLTALANLQRHTQQVMPALEKKVTALNKEHRV